MTRIAENQIARSLIFGVQDNRQKVADLSEEVSSGIKVRTPGDSSLAGTIANFQSAIVRFDGYISRISGVKSYLTFQDDIMAQANELMVRAKEIAEQAANDTVDPAQRAAMAEEIFQIRDSLVSLGNSTYQGRFVYGGALDGTAPFVQQTHTVPATGAASRHFQHSQNSGSAQLREVLVGDGVKITVNSNGAPLFDNAISAIERIGRSMAGFRTGPASTPAAPTVVNVTNPGNIAYTFPTALQGQDIRAGIDLLEEARQNDFAVERANIGSRLNRIETVESLIGISKTNAQEVLSGLQNADIIESASNLSIAQNALEASLAVTSRILQQSILDFL